MTMHRTSATTPAPTFPDKLAPPDPGIATAPEPPFQMPPRPWVAEGAWYWQPCWLLHSSATGLVMRRGLRRSVRRRASGVPAFRFGGETTAAPVVDPCGSPWPLCRPARRRRSSSAEDLPRRRRLTPASRPGGLSGRSLQGHFGCKWLRGADRAGFCSRPCHLVPCLAGAPWLTP